MKGSNREGGEFELFLDPKPSRATVTSIRRRSPSFFLISLLHPSFFLVYLLDSGEATHAKISGPLIFFYF